MSISFPNASRSYDPTRRRVRFWGYDRALEISFFVSVDALIAGSAQPLESPRAENSPAGGLHGESSVDQAESEVLRAFDDGLDRIHEVAASVYARHPGYTHTLTAADF